MESLRGEKGASVCALASLEKGASVCALASLEKGASVCALASLEGPWRAQEGLHARIRC
jgi:hypothetical protein